MSSVVYAYCFVPSNCSHLFCKVLCELKLPRKKDTHLSIYSFSLFIFSASYKVMYVLVLKLFCLCVMC